MAGNSSIRIIAGKKPDGSFAAFFTISATDLVANENGDYTVSDVLDKIVILGTTPSEVAAALSDELAEMIQKINTDAEFSAEG